MRNIPIVSVVIPTFNRIELLPRALDSVFRQTAQDLEVIVVDDGSTDGTADMLSEYVTSGRIHYVRQAHANAASARNRGICESTGRYVAFLDSDDQWLPEKLERQIEMLEWASDSVGFVYCDMQRVLPNGVTRIVRVASPKRHKLFSSETLDYQFKNIGTSAVVVKRECFRAIGLFDENLMALEDLDLFTRIAQKFSFCRIEEPLLLYHSSCGISTNRAAVATARAYLLDKYQAELPEDPRYLASQCARISAAWYLAGDSVQSACWGMKAIRLVPCHPSVYYRSLPGILRLGFLLPILHRMYPFATTL